jgi:hypothetical protein
LAHELALYYKENSEMVQKLQRKVASKRTQTKAKLSQLSPETIKAREERNQIKLQVWPWPRGPEPKGGPASYVYTVGEDSKSCGGTIVDRSGAVSVMGRPELGIFSLVNLGLLSSE